MGRKVLAGLIAIVMSGAIRADDQPAGLEALGWLTGTWIDERGGASSEHYWTSVRGGTLLGLQRDIGPDGDAWVEFVKVHETPEGIVFTVIPLGQAQAEFALVSSSERRAVFENPAHDFPRRIVYWLENDDILAARIEGSADSEQRSSEWRWKRVDP
ncbi:MAG: hypothetical protein H0W33_10070 [Gammaproteobacteria bacterium]|nr:hypothetical protein [Gammaproteobacteria bacterium]